MARNHYEDKFPGSSGLQIFNAVIAGALIGAAAVFLSDRENRKKAMRMIDNLKEKTENKVSDLKEEGLKKVSDELSRTQKKIKKMQ